MNDANDGKRDSDDNEDKDRDRGDGHFSHQDPIEKRHRSEPTDGEGDDRRTRGSGAKHDDEGDA